MHILHRYCIGIFPVLGFVICRNQLYGSSYMVNMKDDLVGKALEWVSGELGSVPGSTIDFLFDFGHII